MIHLIKEILGVEPYIITVRYNTGETVAIDFQERLQTWATIPDSPYSQLLEADYFRKASLDPEAETLIWPNGLDFCPDTLYQWAMEQAVPSVTPQA